METKFYSFNTTWANKWFFGRVSEEDISTVGLPLFYVPVIMRVYHTYSPCLEEGGA